MHIVLCFWSRYRKSVLSAFLIFNIVLLSAGPALALVPPNSVNSSSIINFSIKTVDLAEHVISTARLMNKAVKTSKIQDGAVNTSKVKDFTLKTRDLAEGAISNARLMDNAVSSAKIANGAIGTSDLATGAVTTAKIADTAVTAAKLAADIGVLRLGSGYAGGDRILTGTMSFDGSYATGGELVSISTSLTVIKSLMIVPSKSGYVFEIDETSFTAGQFKVKAFQTGDSTAAPLGEVPAATDLSGVTSVRFEAIGTP